MKKFKAIILAALSAVLILTACQGLKTMPGAPTAPEATQKVMPKGRPVMLIVPEANCISNGAALDALLRSIKGVSEVDVDISNATATIRYDTAQTSIEHIIRVLDQGLFEVTGAVELER